MTTPELNRLWAELIIEELVRTGVDLFVIAPGSRSTPITAAAARHPRARTVVHFDERGSAFFALGYGRATRRPAAWITTSGTALANGIPAVVEASVDGVPMLLLTADRPPELRRSGANQTIDQVGLFGGYVRWEFDVPPPAEEIPARFVLTTVDQAVYRALRPPAGPVHLNAMFREPFLPPPPEPGVPEPETAERGKSVAAMPAELSGWAASARPFTRYANATPGAAEEAIDGLWAQLRSTARGLVVAGRLETPAQADAVRWLSERLGWPVLPDVTSNLRLGSAGGASQAVPYYDLVLASDSFREAYRPEVVLHLGGRSTSKRLLQHLAASRPERYVVVAETPERLDPDHLVTDRIEAEVVSFCQALAGRIEREDGAAGAGERETWSAAWREASIRAEAAVEAVLAGKTEITEPGVARWVTRHRPEEHDLVLASSMPIRDVDQFGAVTGSSARVYANRGASGIDGLVATAAGCATGGRPVTLLIGDLALLHDLNSLALLRTAEVPVVVVVVNNHGGGIFSFLPVARQEDVFERFFATPHPYGFEDAARLFGLPYARPESAADFARAYELACREGRSALLEVVTERAENRALHAELLEAARLAVDRTGGTVG